MTVASTSTDAFEVRRRHFPDEINFHAPGLKRYRTSAFSQQNPRAWLPISLTGDACALQCDHCATKVLQPMIALQPRQSVFEVCQELKAGGTRGVLISGGSDPRGQVPLLKHVEHLRRIKDELGMKVICHTGLVSEETAAGLAWAGVDGAMIDIIGADATIHDVYHLEATVDDFERSLERLSRHGLTVLPHIVMGLHYGQFLGEHTALEIIGRYPVSALILVVLTPVIGTAMQNLTPPAVEDCVAFFRTARLEMPTTRVMLGCARPLGQLKLALDRAAVDTGLNGIAYPAEGIVEYAVERGLQPKFYEYCCSLTWGI
jgi:lipoyl synthase